MTELSKFSVRTRTIASLIVFTALYIVLRFVPYTVLIGGSGFLWLSDLLPPIYGILLGPYVGGLSVLLGNLAAFGLGHPATFFGLDFLPDLMAVVAIGFLVRRKWALVVAINAALLVIFLVDPLTSVFVFSFPFAWLHIVAFIVLLSPLSRVAVRWVDTLETKKISIGMAILALIGTMIQHLTGNILFEVVLGQLTSSVPVVAYPGIWTSVFFVYPVERLILIVSAILIGAPIIWVVNKNSLLRLRKQSPSP